MNQLIVRSNQDERDQPSRTVKIDMEMINTGVGAEQRRLRADLKREIIRMMDSGDAAKRGIKWAEALNTLNQQSSVRVDPGEFAEVVKLLELEGLVKVLGERERRVIRRVSSD